jgi:DNA-binding NtrC family response regulator
VPAPTRPRVLVIDDEAAIRDVLSEFLAMRGFDVEEAATAIGGLAAARQHRPAVILLDLQMPGVVSGAEAITTLARAAPVIVISGTDDVHLARNTLREGAFDYITKPFDLNRLATVIDIAIAHGGRDAR